MAKTVANHPVSDKKSKIAERLAFQPFTPQQDLINELLRNMINPDNDIGKSYYVGEVVKIIQKNNAFIENRDIFYSITDNSERASKNVSDKDYNTDRVTLLVHVPSFITSDKISVTDLNYDNFLKLRVEYNQKNGPIKIGNVVKIQFHKQNSLYFPTIIDFVDVSSENIEKFDTIVKDEFNKYLECKNLSLDFTNTIGYDNFDISNMPYGGYVQAIQEIEGVFSASFIESFKNLKNVYGSPSEIKIGKGKISVNSSVLEKFKINFGDIKVDEFTDDEKKYYSNSKQEYLILVKDIEVKADPAKGGDAQLKKDFLDFLKQEFQSRLGYTLTYGDKNAPAGIDFTLNINAHLSYKEKTPSLEIFIDKSEKTISSGTFYSKIPTPSSTPQIIEHKDTIDKCESQLPIDKMLYPLIYDGEFNIDHNTIDDNIVQMFFQDKIKQSDLINQKYFLKLANIERLEDLLTLNTFFYKEQTNVNDVYLEPDSKHDVGIEYLKNTLKILEDFLNEMQTRIAKNEQISDINDVLIVPRQVLKVKKSNIVSQGEDSNSRHYYGKAVDIAVYLKIKQNNKKEIRQIRPEIVLLYAEKTKKFADISVLLGHGLFLEQQTKYYNHIEMLEIEKSGSKETTKVKNLNKTDSYSILTENERFFTGNSTDIEKTIESATNKLNRLKEIIERDRNFKIPALNIIDPRFSRLLRG